MPNDTLRANAQAMPIDRRALGSLAAAGAAFLALPKAAQAAISADANVFAAVAQVKELLASKNAASDRIGALEELLPDREAFPGLRVREGDAEIFDTQTPVGGTLTPREVVRAGNVLACIRGIVPGQEGNPILRPLCARIHEAKEAEKSWKGFRETERERLGLEEAGGAYDRAADAVDQAALALVDLRPRTAVGVRAIAQALVDVDVFDQDESQGLALLLLETPALDGEA